MSLTVADGRPIADAAWMPRTRKALSRFAYSDVAHVILWWVAWLALLNVVWVRARARADDVDAFPRIRSIVEDFWLRVGNLMRRSSDAIAGAARTRASESGQALVEVALVLPLIFVLLAVLVDGGLAVDRRLVLQHAVREGGRQGALGAAPAAVVTRTVDQAGGLLDPSDVTVCYVDGPDGNSTAGDAGDSVRVQADYTYHFTLGSTELLTAMGGSAPSIDMSPKTEFVLETNVSGATGC
jgi:hypothetical protein